jgi:hypothetical protein
VGESVTATIELQSQSSIPFVFGSEHHNAELFLEIAPIHAGTGVPDRRPVTRDIILMPRNTHRDVVEVSTIFDFLRPGNYRLNVLVRHEGMLFRSVFFAFDVVSGIELLSFRHVLPGYHDVEAVYSFRYATRDGREDAFMVIETPDGRSIYGTFALGPLLRLYQPIIRAREDGSIVAVHQSGNNRFTRSAFLVDRGGAQFVGQRHFRPDGSAIGAER